MISPTGKADKGEKSFVQLLKKMKDRVQRHALQISCDFVPPPTVLYNDSIFMDKQKFPSKRNEFSTQSCDTSSTKKKGGSLDENEESYVSSLSTQNGIPENTFLSTGAINNLRYSRSFKVKKHSVMTPPVIYENTNENSILGTPRVRRNRKYSIDLIKPQDNNLIKNSLSEPETNRSKIARPQTLIPKEKIKDEASSSLHKIETVKKNSNNSVILPLSDVDEFNAELLGTAIQSQLSLMMGSKVCQKVLSIETISGANKSQAGTIYKNFNSLIFNEIVKPSIEIRIENVDNLEDEEKKTENEIEGSCSFKNVKELAASHLEIENSSQNSGENSNLSNINRRKSVKF